MSKTELKNGQKVEEAVIDKLNIPEGGRPKCWSVTVGQVAKAAGVSKPTARKYLNCMVEHGLLQTYRINAADWYQVANVTSVSL